jgi:hypothetical protein
MIKDIAMVVKVKCENEEQFEQAVETLKTFLIADSTSTLIDFFGDRLLSLYVDETYSD